MSDKYQSCIDAITNEFTAGEYYREVYEAKKEFFESMGTIPEDDPDFENQMDVFMGWYLFDRPLKSHELSPAILFYRKNLATIPQEDLPFYKNLTETKHSIYEVLKQKDDALVLRDVGNKEKVEVDNPRFKVGFSKGDVFEARLIPEGKKYFFTNGFCFHPKEASNFIESQMKKIRDQDDAQRVKLLLKLGQMKTKHMRFPYIDIHHIYTINPKF